MLIATHGILKGMPIFISGSSMITYWDFQNTASYNGSGTTITDLDGTDNGLLVGTNPYTSGTPNYISLDNSSSNYARTTVNLNPYLSPTNTSDNISVFAWVYPTSNGVVVSEQGQTTPNTGWYLSTIEWVSGTPRFAVYPYSSLTNVKIFSTHGGNPPSTSQYAQYPLTTSEFDRLFDTSYSNTTLAWEGNLGATTSLNHTTKDTLISAGATVPNGGDYFSFEVNATFIPAETGTYSLQTSELNSGSTITSSVSASLNT